MDRPSKRRRLLAPPDDTELARSFDNRHEFYQVANELYEDSEPVYDPEQDLQQKRARLDLKLKSTFESIFEKYGRDFEGVGDEIDLYTGEILVNNGHLQQMQNERDAGDPSRARRVQRALLDRDDRLETSSVEDDYLEDDDDDDEEDYVDNDALSDEEMMEDDLILRGFTQAREYMERRPALQQHAFDTGLSGGMRHRGGATAAVRPIKTGTLPSRSTILSQFGPQLGPEIVKYVSDQAALEDDNVEPMWRAPPMWPATSARRPALHPTTYPPEIERPISPENSPSIWAPKRTRFTADEDELLQDFVTNSRRTGLDLSNNESWKTLENAHPRHDWKTWKARYEKRFSYLYAGHADDSELSTSEASTDFPWASDHHDVVENSGSGFTGSSSRQPPQLPVNDRPTRVRKQAVRDPTILNWNDAVATIKSVDPDLHAGLLRDSKIMRKDASFDFQRLEPPSPIAARQTIQERTPKARPSSNKEAKRWSNLATGSSGLFDDAEDELSLHSEFHGATQMAPCPHADCRLSQSTLYRLNYTDGEELSPLCLHLLRVHHITPYPCAEFNCDRKGEQGYFLQEDLVKHVKEAHPHPTAISRLRGRVDPGLLDQRTNSIGSKLPAQHRPRTPISQPRDMNLKSPLRPTVQRVQPRSAPSPSTAQDLTQTPRPTKFKSTVSSLHRNPSSQTVTKPQAREYSFEKLCDSDIEILDDNPFLAESASPTIQTKAPGLLSTSAKHDETTTTHEMAVTKSAIQSTGQGKAQCAYPGCTSMISTAAPRNMIQHLKRHEKWDSKNNTNTITSTAPGPQPSLSAGVSEPLSSVLGGAQHQTSSEAKDINNRSRRKRRSDPLPRNTVDPSYMFSDEELELPPLPQETTKAVEADPARPQRARKSMPLPKTSAKASPDHARKKPPGVTPSTKPISTKHAAQGATNGEEDFDELGLPDVLYLSSRPRSGAPLSARAQPQVKQENLDVSNGNVQSLRKRRTSMVGRSDEVDELGSDEIMQTASVRRLPFSPVQPEVKTEEGDAISRSTSVLKSRAATTTNLHDPKMPSLPGPPVATPTRPSHSQTSATSTPLIDLVGGDDDYDLGMAPPTSEPALSSPTARALQSRQLTGRKPAGPNFRMRTTAGLRAGPRAASVKNEEEENSVVWTPGGTLRRCGQDGFRCGRPFCFSCPRQAPI